MHGCARQRLVNTDAGVAVTAVCTIDVQYKVESQAASSSLVCEVVSEYSRRLLDDALVPQPPSGPPVPE